MQTIGSKRLNVTGSTRWCMRVELSNCGMPNPIGRGLVFNQTWQCISSSSLVLLSRPVGVILRQVESWHVRVYRG